jgi:hypothetical protein
MTAMRFICNQIDEESILGDEACRRVAGPSDPDTGIRPTHHHRSGRIPDHDFAW